MSTAATDADVDISELEELIDGPPPRCQTYVLNARCPEEATVTVKVTCCGNVVHLCRRHFEWLRSGGQMSCFNCGVTYFKWIAL